MTIRNPSDPVRVLVVDDSPFARVTIGRMIETDPAFRVIGTAVNGEDAIRKIGSEQPDVITLDLEMPGVGGFAVLTWLAANRPTPTIVVSSRQDREDVFRALELGAVDFVAKPLPRASPVYARLEAELLDKLRAAALVSRPPVPLEAAPVAVPGLPIQAGSQGIIVIGASTGGPGAIGSVFAGLPPVPWPIVVAQHMPAGFTRLFAERLSRMVTYPVSELRDREVLRAPHAYIAQGGEHTQIERVESDFRSSVRPRGPDDLHAPSVDRLFSSAARASGSRVLAVVLTGMGNDGTAGLAAIKSAGGHTIAESSETAIVYGMPRAAADAGVVDDILPLSAIAGVIVRFFRNQPPP